MVNTVLMFVHLIGCGGLIVIILLQSSRGMGLSGFLGGGGSEVLFGGGRRAGENLRKITEILAVAYIFTSLYLSIFS